MQTFLSRNLGKQINYDLISIFWKSLKIIRDFFFSNWNSTFPNVHNTGIISPFYLTILIIITAKISLFIIISEKSSALAVLSI